METINLLQALLRQGRENPNSLSERLRNRVTPAQIYRFLSGETKNPRRSTLEPIAAYYSIPVEAFYLPELAAKILANLNKGASPMIGVDTELVKRAEQTTPVVPPRRVIAPAPVYAVHDRVAEYPVSPVMHGAQAKPRDPLANRRQYMMLDLAESLERFTDLKNLKIAYALAADALDRHFESIKYPPEPDLFATTTRVDTPSPATRHPGSEAPNVEQSEMHSPGHEQTVL